MVESIEKQDSLQEELKNGNTLKKIIKISPSILSLPIEEIEGKVKLVENNIDYVHIDVMDGKFVTNKTSGIEMFNAAKKVTNKPMDVHLMVENPLQEIQKYKGAKIITFHIEAVKNEEEANIVIEKIHSYGADAGISIKPNTNVNEIVNLFDKLELVLVMTVEPGYGGQKLIPEVLEKISELRNCRYKGNIEIDGGVTIENASKIREYDVDIIVAGTAVFSAENENEAILKIKGN